MVKEKNSKERRKDTDTNEAVTLRENGDSFIGIRGIGRGRARRTLLTDSARKKKTQAHNGWKSIQVKESQPDSSANVSVRGGNSRAFLFTLCAEGDTSTSRLASRRCDLGRGLLLQQAEI
jgi:hypothetical protein